MASLLMLISCFLLQCYIVTAYFMAHCKRHLLTLTSTWAIWCNGNTAKIRVEWGVRSIKKPAISLKLYKIGPRLLWQTNGKSHARFRLEPKSITLNGQNVTVAEKKSHGAHQKNFEDISILSAAKCRCMSLVSRNIRHNAHICGGSSLRRRQIQYMLLYMWWTALH